jgi:soluble lytic murein transglycosylase-like protein
MATIQALRRHSLLLMLAALAAVSTTTHADTRAPDPALADHLARQLAHDAAQPDHFDAKVWLLTAEPKLRRYIHDQAERASILRHVYREALRNDIDPDLVMAVIQIESAFDRFAVSRVGAQGLMQVMSFWRAEIGRPQDNLTQIDTSIRYGTAILAHYIEVSRGDLIDALARYNGSRGRLKYPELVIGAYRRVWQTTAIEELPLLRQGCEMYPLVACRHASLHY